MSRSRVLILFALLLVAGSSSAEVFRVGFVEGGLPPFIFDREENPGIFFDVLDALAERTGDSFEAVWAPHNRIRVLFASGAIDLLPGSSPSWESEDNRAISVLSRPFMAYRNVVALRRSSGLQIRDPGDLEGIRVGTVDHYEYAGWENGVQRDDALNEEQLLQKLAAGRYEVAFVGEAIVRHWILERGLDVRLGPVVQETELSLLLHKDKRAALARFDAAIAEMQEDGTLARILERYLG